MTEKRLKALTKHEACGVVPGLSVHVSKLKDGSLVKYFVLRDRVANRTFSLGKYPAMSFAEAFKKAAAWKDKIAQGMDLVAEERALRESLRRRKDPEPEETGEITF